MSITSPSILDLIESHRWKRAVFTTFTLSLTYFEAYILPRLRKQGCGTIDIYVDALGYRDSLIEQRSRHAGRDYTLHPVVVRNGIFHAKLVYLWPAEDEGDLLLVGSGNLTYAGHGGNLEVFEILQPETHGAAFGHAAEFFAALLAAKHVNVGGAEAPLRALGRRATSLARKHPAGADVRFIHSLIEPAVPQLARHLGGRAFDELVVMSPYHNPDAAPIASLVDATGPRRLLISLDSRTDTSPFNFDLAEAWPCEVDACELDNPKARFPHAKWYEWRGEDGAVAFTGSFNATTASLATCDNVECGVIRRLTAPSTHWRKAPRRPFKAQSFPRSPSPNRLIAAATLSGRNLSGRIIGFRTSHPRDWTFTVQDGEHAPTATQTVELTVDGTFEVELATSIDSSLENAMQIHMESGELSARGWVSLPDILGIPPQQRNLLSLLAQFERGTDTAAGFASLLGILMEEIISLNQIGVGLASQNALPTHSVSESPCHRDWTASPRATVTDGPDQNHQLTPGDRFVAALARGQRDWLTLGHLGEILLGTAAAEATGNGRQSNGTRRNAALRSDTPAPETEEEARHHERDMGVLVASLAAFEKLMTECRAALRNELDRSLPSKRGEAMMGVIGFERMWLHVTLRAYAGHLSDIPGAVAWLGRWLRDTAYLGYDQPALDLMLPELAGCAAVLALQALEVPDTLYDDIVARRVPSPASRAVSYLEAACAGRLDVDRVLKCAADWFANQGCGALANYAPDAALRALAIILSRPTARSRVAQFLRERPLKVTPADWRPLPPKALELLKTAIRPPGRRASYGEVDVRELHKGCPVCRGSLSHAPANGSIRRPDPDLLSELKLLSIAACIRCQAPLVERSALE